MTFHETIFLRRKQRSEWANISNIASKMEPSKKVTEIPQTDRVHIPQKLFFQQIDCEILQAILFERTEWKIGQEEPWT